jgi:hypothetical protein
MTVACVPVMGPSVELILRYPLGISRILGGAVTQHYIAGELSVRLAELQAVATTPQSQTSGTWVKIAVEVGPGAQAALIL